MSGTGEIADNLQPGYLPRTPWDAPHNDLLSVARFRIDFPAFADESVYDDRGVQFWLDQAGLMAVPHFWGRMTVLAQELITAHFIALRQYYAVNAAAAGGSGAIVPGMPIGMVQSKSVSKVSVSYDYSSSEVEGAGPWNTTIFGRQYWQMVLLAGTGGFEVLSIGMTGLTGTVQTWARGVSSGYYYGFV